MNKILVIQCYMLEWNNETENKNYVIYYEEYFYIINIIKLKMSEFYLIFTIIEIMFMCNIYEYNIKTFKILIIFRLICIKSNNDTPINEQE